MSIMFLKEMRKRAEGLYLMFVGKMFTFGGINILFSQSYNQVLYLIQQKKIQLIEVVLFVTEISVI